jgi:hypothetical protein
MRVNGAWALCEDGVVRPIIQGFVQLANGQWYEVPFLLDAGADRTVFSDDFLALLSPLAVTQAEPLGLAGIGGAADAITIETSLGFTRDDGKLVTVRGAYAVFAENGGTDLAVLGRDVTNNFGVIYDYPNWSVALLAPPHYYEIKRR